MAQSVQKPLVGQIARYEGVYRPHWEIGHIAVRVSRARKLVLGALAALGLLLAFWLGFLSPVDVSVFGGLLALLVITPAEERWMPCFPPGSLHDLDDEGGPIEFEGIVTARGWYGHMGYLNRGVEVVRVLRYANRVEVGRRRPGCTNE
jgi:hypothetical protein